MFSSVGNFSFTANQWWKFKKNQKLIKLWRSQDNEHLTKRVWKFRHTKTKRKPGPLIQIIYKGHEIKFGSFWIMWNRRMRILDAHYFYLRCIILSVIGKVGLIRVWECQSTARTCTSTRTQPGNNVLNQRKS